MVSATYSLYICFFSVLGYHAALLLSLSSTLPEVYFVLEDRFVTVCNECQALLEIEAKQVIETGGQHFAVAMQSI